MTKTRATHLLTVAGIALSQLQFVWADPNASLANKISTTVVTLLALLFTNPQSHALASTVVRVAVAALALLVSHLLTEGTLGTAATGALTTAAAVFASLRTALSAAPSPPVAGGPAGGPRGEDPGPGTEVRGEGPRGGEAA